MRITQSFAVVYRSRLSNIRHSMEFLFIHLHFTLYNVPLCS
jgi:hypothetical protein